MKTKSMLLAALVLMLIGGGAAGAEDGFDVALNTRATMVAAVAVMASLPPNCTVDHKTPDGNQIARFIYMHGHRDVDAFMAEVKAQMKKTADDIAGEQYQKFSATEKKQLAELTCAYGMLLTAKVRDANK
jgi:hypothetical protein